MTHNKFTMVTILILGSLLAIPAGPGHASTHQAEDSPTLQQIGEKVVAVIQSKRTESLNGYLLIICKAPLWKAFEKDSDVGPFLRYKTAASNLHAVLGMPSNAKDGSTYCVYLEGNRPIGFAEIKTAQGERITDQSVAKAYIPLTEDFDTKAQVRFETGVAYSDDNKPIPTLKVIDDGKK